MLRRLSLEVADFTCTIKSCPLRKAKRQPEAASLTCSAVLISVADPVETLGAWVASPKSAAVARRFKTKTAGARLPMEIAG